MLEDASHALEQHPWVDASDIELSCEGGEITLRGTVSNRNEKRMAEDCVENVAGVKDVRNELRLRLSETSQSQSTEVHRGGATPPK
jgi:osmotically-inducible protein OsmY